MSWNVQIDKQIYVVKLKTKTNKFYILSYLCKTLDNWAMIYVEKIMPFPENKNAFLWKKREISENYS